MRLASLKLSNFRSFKKLELNFVSARTVIVGPNASGKSNLLEAIYLLSTGRSLRAHHDRELIRLGSEHCLVEGKAQLAQADCRELIVQLTSAQSERSLKKFKVNGISRNLLNFMANLAVVVFEPEDIQLVLGAPDGRRSFLNNVLSLADRAYRRSLLEFEAVRRQRNKLLFSIREGQAGSSELAFWDERVLALAPILHEQRRDFFSFLNHHSGQHEFAYHPSSISEPRLGEYRQREIAAGVSLIGPHRDDFSFRARQGDQRRDLSIFGSRGEQRLAVFDLKILEASFLKEKLGSDPVVLLDDIFSELDEQHRREVAAELSEGQVVLTTTEKGFIDHSFLQKAQVISLT